MCGSATVRGRSAHPCNCEGRRISRTDRPCTDRCAAGSSKRSAGAALTRLARPGLHKLEIDASSITSSREEVCLNTRVVILAVAFLAAVRCTGSTGPAGADGEDGADGMRGSDGMNGQNGQDGEDGQDGVDAP